LRPTLSNADRAGGQPTLRAVIALWTAILVIFASLTTGLIFYITIDRDLGADVVGLVLSAFAVGSLGGSLVAARMAFRAVGPVMLVGTVVMGLSVVVVALSATVPVLVGAACVAGLLDANVAVSYLTLRTQLSPDALLGRVGATARTISVGLMPVGSLVTGILLDAVGGAATLAMMGTASIAAGLGFALLPNVRHARVPRQGAMP
jgi:MFS family permease